MKLFETLFSRKSVRRYTGELPSDEQVEIILKAASAAPVASGRYEDMHITVIKDQSIIHAIENHASKLAGQEIKPLFSAPLLILVSVKPKQNIISNSEYSSAAMIVHNMSLAATALGLGSCDIWGSVLDANEDNSIVERYNLPEGYTVCGSIVLGETTEKFTEREIPLEKIKTTFIEP